MSIGSTLPPQAYTREILALAFNWLQSQPDSTRKLATSPDALVGLYLRAQRYGHTTPENDAPVSSQNFVSDLKNLAEGLKQFEDPNGGDSLPAAHHTQSRTIQSQHHQVTLQSAPTAVRAPHAHSAPSGLDAINFQSSAHHETISQTTSVSRMESRTYRPFEPPTTGPETVEASYSVERPQPFQADNSSYEPAPPRRSQPPPESLSAPSPDPYFANTRPSASTAEGRTAAARTAPATPSGDPLTMETDMPPHFFRPPPAAQRAQRSSEPHRATRPTPPSEFTSEDEVSVPRFADQLNAPALQMIQEVKIQLNLNSDAEAMNMMVSIAYKKLKSLLS